LIVAAFDSRVFRQRGVTANFVAPIGAGVRIENEAGFWKAYARSVEQRFDEFNLSRLRFACKSYHLLDVGGPIRGKAVMEKIVEDLLPHVSEVLVCYCILPKGHLPSARNTGDNPAEAIPVVRQYWEDGGTVVTPVIKFMDQIPSYYPVVCASEYTAIHNDEQDETGLLLDNIQGPDNEAWRSILQRNIRIYPSGDEVSPPIALADMMIRLLDLKLHDRRARLERHEIETTFSEIDEKLKLRIRWTGPKVLPKMAAATKHEMETSAHVARPRVPVIGETHDLLTNSLRSILEGTGAWDHLCNLAASVKGSLKVFERTRDRDLRSM